MTEAEESKETKDGTEGTEGAEGALGFQEDTTADPSKATEAVEKPAEPAAEPVKPIYLAGRAFTNRTELQDHVKKIQDSKVNEDASKGDLTVEENLFIFHLLLHHPKAVEKMTKPISHFRYGTYDKFKNKCFISVAVDGTEEGVSAAKSMSVIFPNTSGNGAAATSSATAGLVAVPPPDEKKEKGQKRNREERPPPEPRVFEPQEMVRGCVVDIKGLPPNVNYGRLKELLNGCGKVKFLQLLKVPKASKEPPQKKAKVEEEAAEKADAAEGEKDEDSAKEEEAEEEEESPVTARCRFADPEGASGALTALSGAEVQGATVEVALLEGEEEEAYWEESNRKRKEAFENPRGKGKDGKGKKGKGKGKGKKGKNKSDD